jgi:radical SAM protein with 4Fe4S-binding SPASM domain
MHAFDDGPVQPATPESVDGVLDFLWLELTNRCNLQCVHCYTESDPWSGDRDLLTASDYETLMADAFALGCRKIQLIGGEPQLNPAFDQLLRTSVDIGFEFVEVFTNLTRLTDETIRFSAQNGIHFATSVYSDKPEVHDAVTTVRGSHERTVGNLQRLVNGGVPTRAAVLAMDEDDDDDDLERTRRYVVEMGATAPSRMKAAREFGRGQQLLGKSANMSGLCGHCWNGNLAIAPDGMAYPCVMSREWSVGNVIDQTLDEILHGDELRYIRREIHEKVWQVRAGSDPYCFQSCGPDLSCPCDPLLCEQSCAPWDAPKAQ